MSLTTTGVWKGVSSSSSSNNTTNIFPFDLERIPTSMSLISLMIVIYYIFVFLCWIGVGLDWIV